VIHTVLEPSQWIIQAFSHHLRVNHCFVALYFQKEKPRTSESKASRPLDLTKTILKIDATKE